MQQMQDFGVLREISSMQVNKTKKFKLKKDKCVAGLGTIILVRSLCSMCALLKRHSEKKIKHLAGKMGKPFSLIQMPQTFSKTGSDSQITSDCSVNFEHYPREAQGSQILAAYQSQVLFDNRYHTYETKQ